MESKNAVVFLTKYPQENTLKFAQEIASEKEFSAYVVVDDMTAVEDRQTKYPDVKIIQISDNTCVTYGYHNCSFKQGVTHIQKNPIAWDKFLFFFCVIEQKFDFVWVFEDDVFVPNTKTISNLHKKYSDCDLVVPNHFQKTDNVLDWHWQDIVKKIPPPYFYSMTCAMGLSKKTLNAIKKYVTENKTLFFQEVMFNTLAEQNNLSVLDVMELKSIVWQGEWNLDHWLLLTDNVFHPLKEIEKHYEYREQISKAKTEGCLPNDIQLPDFLTIRK